MEFTIDGLNNNSLIMQWNTDSNGNPTSKHIVGEIQQVSPTHHLIQLAQVPDEYYRVKFVAEMIDGYLIEVRHIRELVNINNFYVDYNHGIVYFHSDLAGRLVRADYYGRGVIFLSDARIFHKSGDSFASTLDEVLDKSRDALELLEYTGGLAQAIELLEQKANEGTAVADRIENFIEETEFYGYTIILSREAFVVKAKEDGNLYDDELDEVYTDVVVYKGAKSLVAPELEVRVYSTTNCECEVVDQTIRVTRMETNAVKAQAIIEIDCGDGLVAQRTIEVTKVFDGISQFNVEMTNSFYSFNATHSGKVEEEQSVTCEFNVTRANELYTGYLVGVQNMPTGMTCNLTQPTENATSVTFTVPTGSALPDNGSVSLVFQIDENTVITKSFVFSKTKQGLSAKTLMLAGNQIIHYEDSNYGGTPTPLRTSITAQVTDLSGTPVWSYLEGEEWIVIDGQNGTNLILYHNDLIWGEKRELTIKCELDGFSDEITLIKVANGATGLSSYSTILSNESTTLRVSADGTIPTEEIESQYTTITAFKGSTKITPTSITVTPGSTYQVEVSGTTVRLLDVDTSTSTVNIPIEIILDNTVKITKIWSIAKTEPGEHGAAGAVYTINIEGGTRAITYNQLNENPRPTFSGLFTATLYENGNDVTSQVSSWYWSCIGHMTGTSITSSFTPEIKDTFDEAILNNSITVMAIYNHMPISYTVPIVVAKDLNGLDWVTDWDSSKVLVKDTEVLTPKLFAGTYDSENDSITGVAIGTDVLNDGQVQGITAWQDNEVTFLLGTDGSLLIGNPFDMDGSGLSYSDGQFVLNVDDMSIAGVTVPSWNDMEEQMDKQAELIVNTIQANIDNMNTTLDEMTNYVDSILQDEVVNELEKVQLDSLFEVILQEVINIQAQYESVINNPYLPDDEVTNLEQCYRRYMDAYENILQVYNDVFGEGTVEEIPTTPPEEEYLETSDFLFEEVAVVDTEDVLDDEPNEENEVSDTTTNLPVDVQGTTDIDGNESLQTDDYGTDVVDDVNEVSLDTLITMDGYVLVTQGGEVITMVTENTLIDFEDAVQVLREYSAVLQQAISQALLSISEYKAQEMVEEAREQILQEVSDVSAALDDLETTMNGSFKSGLIGEQSKAILNERLKQLDIEKKDIDGQYEVLSQNTILNASSKTKLNVAKANLDAAHDILVAKINQVIIDNLMTDMELRDINDLIDEYSDYLQAYSKVAQECNVTIAEAMANQAVKAITDEDVFNKVTNYGVTQGLFIKDEKVYINSEYINTRNFRAVTDDGLETFKIDENGEVSITAKSLTITGQSSLGGVSEEYVDEKISELDNSLNQNEIFNRLTDNGNTQGIYLENGQLYVNGEYINTKNFSAVDNKGNRTFLIDANGEVHINANTFSVGGNSIPTTQEVLNMIDEYGQSENLVITPNFNSGSLSPDWSWSVSSYIYIDTSHIHNDSTACRLKYTGSGSGVSLNTKKISIGTLTPHTKYRLSMWVYCESTSATTGDYYLRLYGKPSGSSSADVVGQCYFSGNNLKANEWMELSVEITPTQEYTAPNITINGGGGNIDVWVTDFSLQQKGESLNQEQIVDILNGAGQGFYIVDGQALINAEYIKTGTLAADLIKVRVDEQANLLPFNYVTMNNAINTDDFYITTTSEDIPVAEADLPIYSGGGDNDIMFTPFGYTPVRIEKGKSYWFTFEYYAQWNSDTKPDDGVGMSTKGESKYDFGTQLGNNLTVFLYDGNSTNLGKGRNLLDHTNGTDAPHIYSGAYVSSGFQVSNSTEYNGEPGHLMLISTSGDQENYYRFMSPNPGNMYGLEPGETYTLSGKACGTMSEITIRHEYHTGISGDYWRSVEGMDIPLKGEDYWQDFELTFTIPDNAGGYYLSVQDYNKVNGKTCYLAHLKLEKSPIPTPWSLSPVDLGNSNPSSVDRSGAYFTLAEVADFNESINIVERENYEGVYWRTWTKHIARIDSKYDYSGSLWIELDGSGFPAGDQGWFYINNLQLTEVGNTDSAPTIDYLTQLKQKHIELTDGSYYTNILGVDGIQLQEGSIQGLSTYELRNFKIDYSGFRLSVNIGTEYSFIGSSSSYYSYAAGSTGWIDGYDPIYGVGAVKAIGGNNEGIFIGVHEGFQVPNSTEYGRADIYSYTKYDGMTAWDDWTDWQLLGERVEPRGLVRRDDYCNISTNGLFITGTNDGSGNQFPGGATWHGSVIFSEPMYNASGDGQIVNTQTALQRIYFGNPNSNTIIESGSQVIVKIGAGGAETTLVHTGNSNESMYIGAYTSETGRTVHKKGVYCFNTWHDDLYQGNGSAYGLGGQYWTTLGWGNAGQGAAEIAVNWTDSGNIIAYRSLRDTIDNWWGWKRIYHTGYQQTSTSDMRYKRAIADVDTSDCYSMIKNTALHHYLLLDDTEELRACSEDGIEELETELDVEGYSRKVQMGIIAQDVLKYECGKYFVVQDIMRDDNGNIISDKYSIDAYNYASAIHGGLQEEIKVRDEQYEELKKENEDLKARIEKLEKLILKGE